MAAAGARRNAALAVAIRIFFRVINDIIFPRVELLTNTKQGACQLRKCAAFVVKDVLQCQHDRQFAFVRR